MQLGIAELRNRLSYYLKQVRNGGRVVVLDRGEPIAELVPYSPASDDLQGRIAAMSQEGWITAQPVRRRHPIEPIRLHRPEVRASRLVSRMRDDR
jgi:prevent-host-death family protein